MARNGKVRSFDVKILARVILKLPFFVFIGGPTRRDLYPLGFKTIIFLGIFSSNLDARTKVPGI